MIGQNENTFYTLNFRIFCWLFSITDSCRMIGYCHNIGVAVRPTSVCQSVTLCIVAKRYTLQQKCLKL